MAFMLVLFLCSILVVGDTSPYIQGLIQGCYVYQQDLNIAMLDTTVAYNGKSDSIIRCSAGLESMRSLSQPVVTEALTYAIDGINSRSDILPNISLGHISLDYCRHPLAAVAVSMYLLPDQNDTDFLPNNELITCTKSYKRFRNVLGVLGPGHSNAAVMNVGLLSVFNIPSILTTATSDELSDKSRFPYSMRLVSPDRFQADAMTDLLLHFGWTYASLLYFEGSYGENGAKQLQKNAKVKGICLAFMYMFPSDYTNNNVEEVVDKLSKYKTARAVHVFLTPPHMRKLINELVLRGERSHFILVGSDSLSTANPNDIFGQQFHGSFAIRFQMEHVEAFRSYYRSLTPMKTKNPWFPNLWERLHNCKWIPHSGERSCSMYADTPRELPIINPLPEPEMILDGVSVYAHALHALIEDRCPEAFADKSVLHGCVKGPILLRYLKDVSLNGFLGPISFDEYGDFQGSYDLVQYHNATGETLVVAVWSRLDYTFTVHTDNLKWFSHLKKDITTMPESVCSKSCQLKEYYTQQELPCCWQCRKCRNNEIIVDNMTGREVCKLLSWPDEDTAINCVKINPTVLLWTDPITLTLITVAIVGMLGCFITSIIFIKNRNVKIIKASSHQLMAVILTGIAMAYATALAFLFEPSIVSCYFCRFGFNLAVGLIYGPLVVKTNRIYRIFESGKTGKRPAFIGTTFQMLLVTIITTIQLSLCVISVIMMFPDPISRMPVTTAKYVASLCNLPLTALVPPLIFNLIVIMLCAVFGFMTRKLPENYNESWYIFVSVATTTFMWLVFLPAYFTTFYTIHQVVLLSSCMLINGTVVSVCAQDLLHLLRR